jgi:hypothetical protein
MAVTGKLTFYCLKISLKIGGELLAEKVNFVRINIICAKLKTSQSCSSCI